MHSIDSMYSIALNSAFEYIQYMESNVWRWKWRMESNEKEKFCFVYFAYNNNKRYYRSYVSCSDLIAAIIILSTLF